MERAKIRTIVLDDDILENRKFMFEKIKDDQRILNFLREYDLSEQFLKDNIQSFYDWIETLDRAQLCESSSVCYSKHEGYYEDLYYDGLLQKRLVPCAHEVKRLKDERFLSNYLVMDFPDRLIHVSVSDILATDEPVQYKLLVAEVAEFLENPKGPGFYIYGDVGVGKTYLMSAVSNELVKLGKKVAFIHTPTLSNNLKGMMSRYESFDTLLYRLKNVDILVFDDIGSENVSDWWRDDILLSILNYRMESNKTCFFTSNLSMNELLNHYEVNNRRELNELGAKRLLERIKMTSKEIELKGKNRRDFA